MISKSKKSINLHVHLNFPTKIIPGLRTKFTSCMSYLCPKAPISEVDISEFLMNIINYCSNTTVWDTYIQRRLGFFLLSIKRVYLLCKISDMMKRDKT